MTLFKSQGTLSYSIVDPDNYYKLSMTVDPQIAAYYRSFIPKWNKCNGTRYAPHVTIVRKEKPKNLTTWSRFEGEIVDFEYDSKHFDSFIRIKSFGFDPICVPLKNSKADQKWLKKKATQLGSVILSKKIYMY